jgi:DNA polymerase-3 subunit chi
MPNIDFYILNETPAEYLRTVCRLIDKAFQQKHQVYVQANSSQEAKVLDDLLWTFRDDSFIPHDILEKNAPATVPIQIGFDIIPKHHKDILLNLSPEAPEFFTQFKRVLEIVPNDDGARKISRKKFKLYRDKSCELKTHDLTKT